MVIRPLAESYVSEDAFKDGAMAQLAAFRKKVRRLRWSLFFRADCNLNPGYVQFFILSADF